MTLYQANGSVIALAGGGALGPTSSSSGGSGKTVLTQSDFTYLGYYEYTMGGDFNYGYGITHRYVSGQLRLMMPNGPSFGISEFPAPTSYNTQFGWADAINGYSDPWAGQENASAKNLGTFWDEANGHLWICSCLTYPDTDDLFWGLWISDLGGFDTIDAIYGSYGLQGYDNRRWYGGAVNIPSWFQSTYGTPAYAVGFGGYSSLVAQRGVPAMGLSLAAMPNPVAAGYLTAQALPTSAYALLSNPGTAASGGTSWWSGGATAPSTYDRGKRLPGYHTDYIEGTFVAPGSGSNVPGQWNGAAPNDSLARWTWGDSYYNTGCWIDGTNKHGFFACLTTYDGNVRYRDSDIRMDDKGSEFHIYNPSHFGQVLTGARQSWDLTPTTLWRPTEIPSASFTMPEATEFSQTTPQVASSGATYDPISKRLFVRRSWYSGSGSNTRDRVFVWSVNTD